MARRGALALACLLARGGVLAQGAPTPGGAAERQAYAQLTLAYAALRANALDSAIVHFVSALELTPLRLDVRKELAYTYFHAGRNDLAQLQFEAVLARDSLDATAAMELAYLYYESTDPVTRARTHALFGRLRASKDSSVRRRATEAFRNVDADLAEKIRGLQAALASQPGNGLLLEQLAIAAQERNDLPLATTTYQQLSEFYGEHVRLLFARFLIATGRRVAAQKYLDALLTASDPYLVEEARDLGGRGRTP